MCGVHAARVLTGPNLSGGRLPASDKPLGPGPSPGICGRPGGGMPGGGMLLGSSGGGMLLGAGGPPAMKRSPLLMPLCVGPSARRPAKPAPEGPEAAGRGSPIKGARPVSSTLMALPLASMLWLLMYMSRSSSALSTSSLRGWPMICGGGEGGGSSLEEAYIHTLCCGLA